MRQMTWRSANQSEDGEKILHLRLDPSEPWEPYTMFPLYKKPDYEIPNGSKGFSTMQHCLKQGFEYVKS